MRTTFNLPTSIIMIELGDYAGAAKDSATAKEWYEKALAIGCDKAAHRIEELEKGIIPDIT